MAHTRREISIQNRFKRMGRAFSTLCDNLIYLYPVYYMVVGGRRKLFKNVYQTFTFWAQYILLKRTYRLLIDFANMGLRGSIMALIGGAIKQLKKLPGSLSKILQQLMSSAFLS